IRAWFVRGVQDPCAGMGRQPRRHSGRHKAASPMIHPDRFLDTPLALLPSEVHKIKRAVEQREDARALLIEIEGSIKRPYEIFDGIAVVPVNGVLVHEESWWSAFMGEMGYDRIRAAFA